MRYDIDACCLNCDHSLLVFKLNSARYNCFNVPVQVNVDNNMISTYNFPETLIDCVCPPIEVEDNFVCYNWRRNL